MQNSSSNSQCMVCGEKFRSHTHFQQHIDQTRHMVSRIAEVPEEYLVQGDESLFYCKLCHKSLSSVSAVLQHHAAKHSAPKQSFYRRCGNCNMEQTTAFGWLNHRGDCKKVPIEIRNKIKLAGLKCIASPETCALRCAGIGMILHLKDEHGIDLNYFEDDFAEFFQKEGLVDILADEETKSLPQFQGLQQQFELSAQSNSERLKRLNEARLRVILSEGEDLATRRAREFQEYMDWLKVEQSQKELERRFQILRQKEDECAQALEAEKRLTAERKQKAASVFAEVRAVFEKTSALVKSNQTAAAKKEVQLMVLKLQKRQESTDELTRMESEEYMLRTQAEVNQLQDQLARLKQLKSTVARIVERAQALAVADAPAMDRHNVPLQLLEPLSKYSDIVVRNSGNVIYDKSMSTDDIFAQETRFYGKKRKPLKIWVPSYEWVVHCHLFKEKNVIYRPLYDALNACFAVKTSVCGFAFNGENLYDKDAFESWYVFQNTVDNCYFFIKRLIGVDAFAKRFMTDPVLFFQAMCLHACNTERFGSDFVNEFSRLLLAEHDDFGDLGSHVDEKAEDVADTGDNSSFASQKANGKKSEFNVSNNLVKYACCIPKALRYTLQAALPSFSRNLIAKADRVKLHEGQEFLYTSNFGDNYTILFGSAFYLDIMEARSLLKRNPPRVREYLRACFEIRFDVQGKEGVLRLELPWQDVVLSVHASGFLCSDLKPSHHDWCVLLGDFVHIGFCDHELAVLLSSDISVLSEQWIFLDDAYASPAKGFFDFEQQSKTVFQNVLQEDLSNPTIFHDPRLFENWWSHLLTLRCQKEADHQRNREVMQQFAPAMEPAAFWDISSKALWLLDFIRYSREIMQDEYDRVHDVKLAGSKRPLNGVEFPKTIRQFFVFFSELILNYESFELKELLCVHAGTPHAKFFRDFSEWLVDHNLHQQAR